MSVSKFEANRRRKPVNLRDYGQTVCKLERTGAYSTPQAIEARGTMHRLMKRRPQRARC